LIPFSRAIIKEKLKMTRPNEKQIIAEWQEVIKKGFKENMN